MAHYSIEIRGAAPIDWTRLRKQRDSMTSLLARDRNTRQVNLLADELGAIRGVRNMLDAMLDTHDDEYERHFL